MIFKKDEDLETAYKLKKLTLLIDKSTAWFHLGILIKTTMLDLLLDLPKKKYFITFFFTFDFIGQVLRLGYEEKYRKYQSGMLLLLQLLRLNVGLLHNL